MSLDSAPQYKIAAAGSTAQTVKCLQALSASPSFQINWVLTPAPKKIGRNQVLTKNPVHLWVEKHNQQSNTNISLAAFDKKINNDVKLKIQNFARPDLLLVVDFGYLIPDWLLELPAKAPVNLHPSQLPRWRGGSPGQMIILSGQNSAAVTLMRITQQLDAGPIIKQQEFKVENDWTSEDFYNYAFELAAENLSAWLKDYLENKLKEKPQPAVSPTRIAREISKQDAFVPWRLIQQLLANDQLKPKSLSLDKYDFPQNSVLKTFLDEQNPNQLALTIERASRAFYPWPILWTKVQTKNGKKRMQILSCEVGLKHELVLKKVKIAGQVEADWNQVKNGIINT